MSNMSACIIKAPKLCFMDTSLYAYLCEWQDARMLEDSVMGGSFFEIFVVSELVKNASAYGFDPRMMLYYYRDIGRKETGFLLPAQGALHSIEAKNAESPARPTPI